MHAQGHLVLMSESTELVTSFVRPRVLLSGGRHSDKCTSHREVNGGIELWSGLGCQHRHGANFHQQGCKRICVPVREDVLCVCARASTVVHVPPGTVD